MSTLATPLFAPNKKSDASSVISTPDCGDDQHNDEVSWNTAVTIQASNAVSTGQYCCDVVVVWKSILRCRTNGAVIHTRNIYSHPIVTCYKRWRRRKPKVCNVNSMQRVCSVEFESLDARARPLFLLVPVIRVTAEVSFPNVPHTRSCVH